MSKRLLIIWGVFFVLGLVIGLVNGLYFHWDVIFVSTVELLIFVCIDLIDTWLQRRALRAKAFEIVNAHPDVDEIYFEYDRRYWHGIIKRGDIHGGGDHA